MQASLTFRIRCFVGCAAGGRIIRWGAIYWIQTLWTSGRSWNLWVPSRWYFTVPGVVLMARVCLSLSYPFWCGYCGVLLISGLLSERVGLCVAVNSVHRRKWVPDPPISPSWTGTPPFFLILHSFLYLQCFTLSRHSVHVCLINEMPLWKQLIVFLLLKDS